MKIKIKEVTSLLESRTKPYLDSRGLLVVPLSSNPRYPRWKPIGMRVRETEEELGFHLVN